MQRPLPPPCRVEVHLDWSWSRLAIDRAGRLVELVDVPATPHTGTDPDRCHAKWFEEPRPVLAVDATVAAAAPWSRSGIEMGTMTYQPAASGPAVCWQYSPVLGRVCGQVVLARAIEPPLKSFEKYLLRLNANMRFVRLGRRDDSIALQAVVPSDDPDWLAIAEDALIHVRELLQKQTTWWDQPRVLVKELFRQARL